MPFICVVCIKSLYSPHHIQSLMLYPSDSADSPPIHQSPIHQHIHLTSFVRRSPFHQHIHLNSFVYQCPIHQIHQIHLSNIDSYKVCFKVGNISVCNSCRKNLLNRTKLWFSMPRTNIEPSPRQDYPPLNIAMLTTIPLKYAFRGAAFNQRSLVIPDAVKDKLTLAQKNHGIFCSAVVSFLGLSL